jgi:hypothetical protein
MLFPNFSNRFIFAKGLEQAEAIEGIGKFAF